MELILAFPFISSYSLVEIFKSTIKKLEIATVKVIPIVSPSSPPIIKPTPTNPNIIIKKDTTALIAMGKVFAKKKTIHTTLDVE